MLSERDYQELLDRMQALRSQVSERLSGSLVSNPALAEEINRQLEDLVQAARDADAAGPRPPDRGLAELVGVGPEAAQKFGDVKIPQGVAEYDENVNSERVVAVGDLYYIYQHERIGVFRVVQKLKELFEGGAIRLSGGDGAYKLYQFDRRDVLRYTRNDRVAAYRRVLGYGRGLGAGQSRPNTDFHMLFSHFVNQVTLFWRDKRISDVIRERALDPSFGSIAVVRRAGLDLRNNLKFTSYGHLNVLRVEVMQLLEECFGILGSEDVKDLFGAANAWDVVDEVLIRYFDVRLQSRPRQRMAVNGREVLRWLSGNHVMETGRGQFEALLMEIAEPAEEWLTSAQAMSLAMRRAPTGSCRGSRWAKQASPRGTASGRPRRCRPPRAAAGRSTRAATAWAPTAAGRAASPSARAGERWHRPRCSPPPGGGGWTDAELRRLARDPVRQRRPGAGRGCRPRGPVARVLAARPRRERADPANRRRAGRRPRTLGGTAWRAAGGDLRPLRRAAAGPGWSSDPFTPVVRAGVLYARGAGDDKGQLFAHLCALDAWRQADVPPVQVLVIAEGAEEVGSPGFDAVLRQRARRVRPKAVVISDTERDERRRAERHREPARPPRRPGSRSTPADRTCTPAGSAAPSWIPAWCWPRRC